MTSRLVSSFAALLLLTAGLARAEDTNTATAGTNAMAMAAGTNAPAAAAPADTGPTPDPSGTKTGASSDAAAADGTTFVPAAPAALSADDQKDPAKVKDYTDKKKAYDDYVAQSKIEPLAVRLSDSVGHNRVAINFMWTLITGFLVMFMQAGFALVETGLCRAKNAGHTMSMNFMIYPMGMLGFYVCGFAFMFGGLGAISTMGGYPGLNHELTINLFGKPFGLLGLKGFMLQGAGYDTAAFALFLFQMVFMDTTATIPTGAAAERWKFSAFMIYGCCIGTMMYPLFGNWVWGGGWLSQLGVNFGLGHGHVDFAGSSVVHMQGGVIALIFAWLIGPRYGKYDKNGKIVHPIVPHNIPLVMLGTFILAFGWFGFNPGSSLAGTDLRIAVVAVNTMLASAWGALGATLWMWWFRTKKPDPSMMCNGMLAGLVAITCPCAFVSAGGASILGLVAGILVVESVFFFDKLGIDDCVGAISVHGVNGCWGCLSLGLFADGTYGDGYNGVSGGVKGLFYGGGLSQFIAEFIGVTTCFITLSVLSLIVYYIAEKLVSGNRVSLDVEIEGLDVPEMGVPGYSGVVMDKQSETPMPKGEPHPVLRSGVGPMAKTA
ncbi:MAG TPA: ammonium transporter [Candidatus Acidoferrum sp.]|jgi:Amt family ammonium transporter|nr:ammonium transporter [Candidatus Acidoferrum sp.]